MAFPGIMVVGVAMNLLGGIFKPKPPAMNMTYQTSLAKTLANTSATMQKMWEKPAATPRFSLDIDPPDFPDKAAQNFEAMQGKHEGERTAFMNKFQQEHKAMKEEFFAKNHYETKQGPDGKPQVALNQKGKPHIAKGQENPTQQVARQNFEGAAKAKLLTAHATQKQQFVQEQKSQINTFLDSNKFQLSNPGVQSELSKVIVGSQKKALKMQRDHEEEFYKVDLPIKEMKEKVGEKMDQYRELERQQLERERNSPAAKELANYQQDLVALLDAKRAEAREEKRSEMFLQDPRKFLNKTQPKPDLATVLPMNIVAALEAFDINQLPG